MMIDVTPATPKKRSFKFIKFTYYSFVVAVIGFLLYCSYIMFEVLAASILLTLVLSPFVNYFETRGFSRFKVILCIYAIATLIFVGMLSFIVPQIIDQTQAFTKNIPTYQVTLEQRFIEGKAWVQQKFPEVELPDFLMMVKAYLFAFEFSSFFDYIGEFFSALSVMILVPFIAFFMLLDGHIMKKFFLGFVPNSYFEMSVLLYDKVIGALNLFIRGQIIDASAVGILTTIGLASIGLPYFFVIGIIAGVGNLIPYLGPIIGMIPAILVAAMQPEGLTMWSLGSLAIVFALVQFIEGTFVYPIAVAKSVNLHPLVIIVGVTIGGQLGGILGMLLTIPLIGIVKVTFEVFYSYLRSYSII